MQFVSSQPDLFQQLGPGLAGWADTDINAGANQSTLPVERQWFHVAVAHERARIAKPVIRTSRRSRLFGCLPRASRGCQ